MRKYFVVLCFVFLVGCASSYKINFSYTTKSSDDLTKKSTEGFIKGKGNPKKFKELIDQLKFIYE